MHRAGPHASRVTLPASEVWSGRRARGARRAPGTVPAGGSLEGQGSTEGEEGPAGTGKEPTPLVLAQNPAG